MRKRILSLLLCLCMAAAMLPTVALAADTTPPAVTGVTPGGTDVPVSGDIAITFNEAMNTTVAGAVYLSADSGTTYGSALTGGSWSAGDTVYTIPYSGLSNSTAYTVKIEGFQDTDGNTLAVDSAHSFTTCIRTDFTVTGGSSGTDYTYQNDVLTFTAPGDYTVSMTSSGATTTNTIVVNASGSSAANPVNITLQDVSINVSNIYDACAFDIRSGSTVSLTLSGTNTLTSGEFTAGLHVPSGAALIIGDDGTLTATGGNRGAGIGGNDGAVMDGSSNGNGGSVTIIGGTVTANGGDCGAGIGGGNSGSGGNVYISGGSVNANGGGYGAGIGGGSYGDGGNVYISGGSVKASPGDGAMAIGKGDDGYDLGILRNSDAAAGVNVYLTTVTLSGISARTRVTSVQTSLGYDYGTNDMYTDSTGKLYLYLPNGAVVTAARTTDGATVPTLQEYVGEVTTTTDSATSLGILSPGAVPPRVSSVSPSGTDVPITTTTLSVTFDEVMDTGTAGTVALDNGATVQNPVWSNGDKTVTYELSGLAYGTSYSITISGFKDAAGNTMAADSAHSFTTAVDPDTILPIVTGVTPAGTDVSISGNVVITFSKTMDKTVAGAVYLSADSGTTYGSALTGGSWSAGDTVYTIPYSVSSYSTVYTIKIEGFQDAAGNTMAVDSTHSFTTCIRLDFTVTGGTLDTDYIYQNGVLIFTRPGDYTVSTTSPGATTTNTIVVNASGSSAANPVNITLQDVSINVSNIYDACAFDIRSGSIASLTLSGTNTLTSGYNTAGLRVPTGAALIIDGDGTITATGGSSDNMFNPDGAAGIGGNKNEGVGAVTINGGTVTANGGEYSAGIGGGYYGSGGTVNISGGTVNANGGMDAAGIGGGLLGNGGTVNISGGTVNAKGGNYGAGIGGGCNASGGTIHISGGTVNATGGHNGAGIGGGCNESLSFGNGGNVYISGGSVKASPGDGAMAIGMGYHGAYGGILKNSEGVDVYLTTVTLSGISARTRVTFVQTNLGYDYGTNDMYTDSTGNLYIYLPGGAVVTEVQTTDGAAVPTLQEYMGLVTTTTDSTSQGTLLPGVAPPTVSSVSPSGTDISITTATLSVTFSEAINTTAAGTVALDNGAVVQNPRWSNGNKTVTYDLSGLAYGTAYSIAISGFKDRTGNTMAADNSHSFTTAVNPDTILPTVTGVTPAGTGVFIRGNVVITFSKTMDTTVAGAVYLSDNGRTTYGSALTGGSWSAGNTVYTIPYSGLSYSTAYTVKIEGFQDAAGNTLAADSAHSFTTGIEPDFTVTGETLITDYTVQNNVLIFSAPGDYTVSMTISGETTTTDTIVVNAPGSSAANPVNITLQGVSIDVSGTSNACAFEVWSGSTASLTLSGTNTLTSGENKAGLYVDPVAALIIGGDGRITATGGTLGAGIGGGNDTNGGNVTITGGTVTAKGGNYGAGIGGGFNASGGTINISGGTVTATGAAEGAGIGGGSYGSGGSVSITGGIVTAKGGQYSAGIGGGDEGSGGSVSITGGTVTATGGKWGAGIGGGRSKSGGTIHISGGTVTATGGECGAGIGGGDQGSGGSVSITGGTVTATGGTLGAGIGGGFTSIGGNVYISGGSVKASPGASAMAIGSGAYHSPSGILKNSDASEGVDVYLTTVTLSGISGMTRVTSVQTNLGYDYGADNMYTDAGKLYLYLPNGAVVTAVNIERRLGAHGGTKIEEYVGEVTTTTDSATSLGILSPGAAPPRVSSVSPSGTDVPITTTTLSVTFDEVMDTGTAGTVALDNGATVQNPVWSNGDKTVTYDLSGLAYSTDYSIIISGFKDAAGNTMAADSTHSFTTCDEPDTTPPAVTGVAPGGADVPVSGDIAITFNEAMNTTVAGAVYLSADSGTTYGSALTGGSWSAGDTVYTIPYSGLSNSTAYTVKIEGFKDTAGNTMAVDSAHSFTTCIGSDFTVTGGTLDTDYTYHNGVLTFTAPGDYTVSMTSPGATTTTDKIVVNASGSSEANPVNITLQDVSINLSGTSAACAIDIRDGSTVSLTLSGTNTLTSGNNMAGLLVYTGAVLIVDGDGTLNATGGYTGAGIGGSQNGNGGTVHISGGTVTATGGYLGAGIGGGRDGDGGTVHISGGTVTATGGAGGAGIGGGASGNGGSVTITGGMVNATGGVNGAGISGGSYGDGGTVHISGGTVNATGGESGAGIGGGARGNGGSVTITGGMVTATGGSGGAGIGGGAGDNGGSVTITGGTVNATGGRGGAGIGGSARGSGGNVYISGGSVKALPGDAEPKHGSGVAIGRGAYPLAGDGGDGILKNFDAAEGVNVYLTTVTLSGISARTRVTSVQTSLGYDYGTNDMYTDSTGKLYLYLPDGAVVTAAQTTDGAAVPTLQEYVGSVTTTTDSATSQGTLAVPPMVLSVSPSGTGVSIATAALSVTFSEAMDTGTAGTVALDNGATVQNPVWSNGDKTVTYDLSGLAYSTDYSIIISGFKDAAGNTMAADSTHSFTTADAPDTTLPTATGVTPVGTGASISGNIVITFNETMDTTVTGAVYLSDDGGTTYGSALTGGSWSDDGTVYSLNYSGLSYSTEYTVLISDFKDAAGNTMAADSSHSFTTCDEPLVPSVSPDALTVYKGGTASLTIAFGQGGAAATEADITVGDSGIASVSQTHVTTPGSVTVTGIAVGTTDITVVFNDTASTTATVSVTVWAQSSDSSDDDRPPKQYKAGVRYETGEEATLPVTVDKNTKVASVDAGAQILAEGGAVITIPAVPDIDAYSVSIQVPSLSTTDAQGTLTLNTDKGSITVPSNMLAGVEGISDRKAEIAIAQGDKEALPDEVKTAIGDKPLVQLTLSIDGKQTDWSNPAAPVTVSIPYTPTAAELQNPESIVVWYIDGSGNVVIIPNGRYDAATGTVSFFTTHFSDYAVTYVHKTFSDLGSAEWARKAIETMAAKGITSGTGDGTTFSPGLNITRADFMVLLIKTLGLTAEFTENFDDVKPNAYYYNAIGIAKKLGIAAGSGNNLFKPTESISRQDMMVLAARALEKYQGLETADTNTVLERFTDRKEIAEYAAQGLATLIEAGITEGSGGKLTPRTYTTRAEVAAFLYKIYNKYPKAPVMTASTLTRLAGQSRIDTALAAAKAAYPEEIKNAVIATAYNYPDALSGSVLAYQLDAPILLAGSLGAEQEAVISYLKGKLRPEGTVYILGGSGVVSQDFEDRLSTSGITSISRLAGNDRYETSVKIAEQLNVETGTPVVLVSGENYPDALAVSSVAAQRGWPILLVQKDGISKAVSEKLADIKPERIYIIGLEGAIGKSVESQAATLTGLAAADIVRLGGADRYSTSLAVAEYFNLGSQAIFVATGENFPDALAGSVYAANQKAPIILTASNLPSQTAYYIKDRKPAELTILGGEAVVGSGIEGQILQLLQ